MEGIIILIISLIVGSVLKGKDKKAPPEGEAKPFTAQQAESNPVKKFKEMSQEMYKDLQKEMQLETERERPSRQQTIKRERPIVSPATLEVSLPVQEKHTEVTAEPSRRRHRSVRSEDKQVKRTIDRESLIPKSEEDLIKGVIFSEIFGPPKSRR